MVISAIELFSGTAMLGEGLRAGFAHMGVKYRTICHVEREAYAASVLVARMQEGSLDEAPIWSDVCTFSAKEFRGKVDCIVAGSPCQDLSIAGRRVGLDGKRSGLFFEVTRIAADCGAWLIFLENVAGISSATASVVDEAEGELDERAAARVVGELADLGWDAEWITLSASDVGASHRRARWFCFAWRDVADTGRLQRIEGYNQSRSDQATSCRNKSDDRATDCSSELADPCGSGQQGHELGGACNGNRGGQEAYGSVSELCGLFAPGPADSRWRDILENFPEAAPALESNFRGIVNGLAFDMGDSRAARLKCVGNGVVAAQAACAFVVLARRAGIFNFLFDQGIVRAA